MSLAPAPTVGLARPPAAVQELLDEAAANAEAAAVLLHALAEQPLRAPDLLDDIADRECDGDRITHDLRRELAHRLVLGFERGDLLRLVELLDDVVDAVDDAAHDLSLYAVALTSSRMTTIAAVLRDLVRTSMRALRRIEYGPPAQTSLQQRAHELRDELRHELRVAYAALLDDSADALGALQGETVLARVRSLGDACARLLSAAHALAMNHSTD